VTSGGNNLNDLPEN